jgi:hypothetical protein
MWTAWRSQTAAHHLGCLLALLLLILLTLPLLVLAVLLVLVFPHAGTRSAQGGQLMMQPLHAYYVCHAMLQDLFPT